MLSRSLFLALAVPAALGAAPALDYGRDIRPILSENCFHCHGQDPQRRMANLRLDTAEGARANGVLVPGNAAASKLYQRLSHANAARRMPPASSNRQLTPEQITLVKRWIDEGGRYSAHWAFIPPRRTAVPAGREPIGYFVAQRLAAENLKPNGPAAPRVWLRRASLDLTGLPPTPAELDAFEKNPDYAKAADRLLASPRYGERLAMDWLDVARYADTHGFNNDSERSMWRWRDWVIEAFNRNLPYDRFLTEQLAGDLLPGAGFEQRLATGFGRNHVINSEGGIIEEEYRVEYVADRVRTLGMAWLGLTLECARCHDHKYDPLTQRDHYRFFAFFNNVPELGEDGRVANAVPLMPAPTREQQARLRWLEAAIAKAKAAPPPAAPAPVLAPPPADPAATIDLTASETVPVPSGSRFPLAFSLWLAPAAADRDVALFSTMDYARSMASVRYGAGVELRLVNGEIEFRSGQRFPAYSMRVRSQGAALAPGQWRHVAVVYSGALHEPEAMRAKAAWVRMFADGHELPVTVLNDGAPLSGKSEKPARVKFRIGHDNAPAGGRFSGQWEKATIWDRELRDSEIESLSAASPHARPKNPAERPWRALERERLALLRQVPDVMVMEEMPTPRATHVLKRGQYDQPGERVEPGVPEALLGAWPAGAPRNRLGLAQWLTKPDHPLTARVVVNRFWQQLFGVGLVKTSENFGVQGESPVHPELLDWLAREFVDSGWNVKALMKRLVLSEPYRRDAAATPDQLARDPENRLLARGPRVRLPAETIRDQALFAAGLLTERLGGPSVFPAQPAGLYKGIVVAADYPGTAWTDSPGPDRYRRSLYTYWKRTVPHPTMTVFDAPDREFCIVRRSTTNTPLQALTLLNDPIYVEAARELARRVLREGGPADAGRLRLAFVLSTGRTPDPEDLGILVSTLERMRARHPGDELAAWSAVTAVILNLDEAISK